MEEVSLVQHNPSKKYILRKLTPLAIWGPLPAILDFAGSGVLQAVSEPRRREAGKYVKVLAKR